MRRVHSTISFSHFRSYGRRCPYCGNYSGNWPDSGECPICGETS